MEPKVVYAYLVADILHYGHIKHLYKSKQHGDFLIVGILTDKATMEKKQKPIIPYTERKRTVESIKYVDKVVPQYKYSPSENVDKYKPDVLIESDSHDDIGENPYGKVVINPYYKGISSTSIKNKIKKEWI